MPAVGAIADGFDHTWRPRLDSLLAAGRGAGADLVEIFLERTDHIGVLAEQDTITSVSPAFGMGAGIRVFRGERDGFVSTNDLSDRGLLQALEQALGMLGLTRTSTPAWLAYRSQAPARPSEIWHSTGHALHSTLAVCMRSLRGRARSCTCGSCGTSMAGRPSVLVCSVIVAACFIEPWRRTQRLVRALRFV